MAEKRDLKADMELCNKATPGPWEYLYEYSYENDYPRTIAHRVRIGEETLTIDTHDPNWEGAQEAISNAKCIAQAREGWPHAIERALKAEALVREQENQIDILSTTLAMYCTPYYDMQERALKAERANKLLCELIAETADLLERLHPKEALIVGRLRRLPEMIERIVERGAEDEADSR